MSTALLLLQDATNHLDDYLIASGLTEGLADISPRWFTLAELEETSVRKALRKMERILLVGSLVDFTHADPLPLESLIRFQGRVPTPLVPIGLRIGALVSPKLKTFLENCGKATDVFSAADAKSAKRLRELFPKFAVFATACPSLWNPKNTLETPAGHPVSLFSPHQPTPHAIEALADLRKKANVLFMAQTATALNSAAPGPPHDWALPGPTSLFAPHFPELHAMAIAAAEIVVSHSETVRTLAVRSGIPAFALGGEGLLPCPLYCEDSLALIEQYPWKAVLQTFENAKTDLRLFLAAAGLRRAAQKSRAKKPDALTVACITDSKYFPLFLGLYENLRLVHGQNIFFHVLAIDEESETRLELEMKLAPIARYTLEDLWQPHELPAIKNISPFQRANASKARLLKHALAQSPGKVLYLDCDLYFRKSPIDALADLKTSVLLFTQYNDVLENNLLHGGFNAGMVGCAKGAEDFLEWWAQLCLHRCAVAPEEGYFVDQGYFTLAPTQFSEIQVCFRADHNVGHWGHRALGVRWGNTYPFAPQLFDGTPIASVHCSQPEELGLFELKSTWDQFVSFFRGNEVPEGRTRFYTHVIAQQQRYWPKLHRLYRTISSFQSRVLGRSILVSPGQIELFWSASSDRLLKSGGEIFRVVRQWKRRIESTPEADSAQQEAWIRLQRGRISGEKKTPAKNSIPKN